MNNRSENLLEYGSAEATRRYTHYLFRYPAKFHPPVARALLERHTEPGDCVLDCFSGSGTLLVEAALSGRSAVGSDVDPVAAFVSRVKATPLNTARLRKRWGRLEKQLAPLARSAKRYDELQWQDISQRTYRREVTGHVSFAVEDIDAVVAGLRARGAELVGELGRYEDSYRLCYVRGPEGIIIELAEQIG